MNPRQTFTSFWALILAATAFSAAAQTADLSAFKIITDRNIFNPNRQPHSRFNTVRSSSARQVIESIALVGTMSYEKGDFAFFDGTSPEFCKALKLNESIAGFTVAAISTNFVKLAQGTNAAIVTIGTQLRRDDAGNWAIPDSANRVGRGRRTGWKRDYGTNRPPVEIAAAAGTGTNTPATTNLDEELYSSQFESFIMVEQSDDSSQSTDTTQTPPDTAPAGNPDDPLTRLMQLRAREEQQLGSPQRQ